MTDSFPTLTATTSWLELLQPPSRAALEALLPAYIQPRRWFGAKARGIATARIVDTISIRYGAEQAALTLVELGYGEGSPDTYVLPLAFAAGARADDLAGTLPHAVVARVHSAGDQHGLLYDALLERGFCAALLELIANGGRLGGEFGAIQASPTSAFARLRGPSAQPLEPKIVTAEQSNSSIIYGDRLIMKLFRRLAPGLNPDPEIGRFLTKHNFAHVPPAAGTLEYHSPHAEPSSLAFLQGFAPNQGDAWDFTLGELSDYFKRKLASQDAAPASGRLSARTMLDLSRSELPRPAEQAIGNYLGRAQLLGRRTAELHLALAIADESEPDFRPEPFGPADQRAIYESMHSRAGQSFETLRSVLESGGLPQALHSGAAQVLGLESQVFAHYQALLKHRFTAMRTRLHGDYHLGQVLYTGTDFMIIDFEGEPARPLSERRRKGAPLQDVAGMLRSFHYAPYAVLLGQAPGAAFGEGDFAALEPWARHWHHWVSVAFLQSYLATAGSASFLPASQAELERLLDAFLLDKAIYELNYELNNRPAWVQIPVEGILQLVASEER